jgi:hypothetical protein
MAAFLLGLIAAVPISYFIKVIRKPQLRLLYCVIMGVIMQVIVFDLGMKFALTSSLRNCSIGKRDYCLLSNPIFEKRKCWLDNYPILFDINRNCSCTHANG